MEKINEEFIRRQYQSGVETYRMLTRELGLWESERAVFSQYLKHGYRILDLGCGTGRTTFALHGLGYKQLIGVDLTPEMIDAAKALNTEKGLDLDFRMGDARDLHFKDADFDAVVFSFNGWMSIPQHAHRQQALAEIARVLRAGGIFIFTTHDRENTEKYREFWHLEQQKWERGQQSTALYEFGDLITLSHNETREIFIHIPDMAEVEDALTSTGFEILDTFLRSERYQERKDVLAHSGDCRFWIGRKNNP